MNVSNKTVRIWRKNLKQGYRFFEPHNATQMTPRTMKEAYGYTQYNEIKSHEYNMNETTKAYIATLIIVAVALVVSLWQ